jgi:site-specific recombinase XerD
MALREQNGKWHYRFEVNGRRYFGSTDLVATEQNRTKAARQEAQAHRLVTEGKADLLKLEVRPFDEVAKEFLEFADGKHRDHPATATRLRTSFASLGEFFKSVMVHTISEGQVDDYGSWRRREHRVRDVTIRHDLHALSKFFQYATKHNWCRDNPVRRAEMPSDAESVRIRLLTDVEERAYFEKAARFPNLRDLGRLMLNQGCRPDELMSLPQADVDLERGLLHIRRGKTKAAKRTLKLTGESKAILARRLNGGTWVFKGKKAGTHLTKLNNPHEKVLDTINPCAECGRMKSEHRRGDHARCRKYRRGAVLEFVLYDLRHTFATRMVEAGCSLPALAAILGHNGLRMVMRYVHPQQEHKDAAMVRYEEYLTGKGLRVAEGRVQ